MYLLYEFLAPAIVSFIIRLAFKAIAIVYYWKR